MDKVSEIELLLDIRRFIQAGFLATVAVGMKIRNRDQHPISDIDLEDAADILRRASATLGGLPDV
jgi:hypothetical protein